MNFSGESAAVATALCWAVGSLLFTFSGRRVGSGTVNRVRLWIAFFLLLGLHEIMFGSVFPFRAGADKFMWLGLSGLVGYVLGDGMLLESFVLIGPRTAMLLMTLVPIFGAALGRLFLDEKLRGIEMVAIAVTLAGIGWVVSEKKTRDSSVPGRGYGLGVLLGIGGALGQAVGLLLAKKGLAGNFSAISGNLIRVSAASAGIFAISLLRGTVLRHIKKLRDKTASGQILAASFLGPVAGVILSLYAIAHTQIGIASTLMSLAPVFLLPLSHFVMNEVVTVRAITGTVIAVVGSVLLFLY